MFFVSSFSEPSLTDFLLFLDPIVLGQGSGTLMDPEHRDTKWPRPRAGPGPGESILVFWARAQGSVVRAPYIGGYNPDTHVGGHRPVASLRPTV